MAPTIDNTNEDCQEVPSSPNIDVNRLLEILADPQRRSIVEYLASTTENTATAEEIVEYVAEKSKDREKAEPELAEIMCHHKHLPKLSDAGLIKYDPRMRDVRYHRHRVVEHLLETVNEIENYL